MGANWPVNLAVNLPRGGFRLLKMMGVIFPKLRHHELKFRAVENVSITANLTETVFFPLLKYGAYPHQVTEDLIIMSFLKSGDNVIDVGANIGHISALCADCIGEEGVVYSFEPSNITFNYLLELSRQMPQIRPIKSAVSSVSGKSNFVDESSSDLSHLERRIDGYTKRSGYEVECITLDEWMTVNQINHLDFLKIDVEGHDIAVLQGARRLINHFEPAIEFEMFSQEQAVEALAAINANNAYTLYKIYNRYPFSLLTKYGASNNYFAIPHSKKPLFPSFLFNRKFLMSV